MSATPLCFGQVEPPPNGINAGLCAVGTHLVVLNKDAKTLTTNAQDPWAVKGGAHASHAHVIPWIVPRSGLYLDLFPMWGGTADLSTAPTIRVFGRCPRLPNTVKGYPQHYDTTDFEEHDLGDMWIPLVAPAATTAPITFEVEAAIEYSLATPNWAMGLSKYVYLAGVREVMVTISTAAVMAGEPVMIGGRVVG